MDGLSFENFLQYHKPQLQASNVPKHFWNALYRKLKNETFDAGLALQLMLIEYDDDDNDNGGVDSSENSERTLERLSITEGETLRPVYSLGIACEDGIKARDPNAIYLIDHAFTFRVASARRQLESHEQLADRLCAMTGIDIEDSERIDKILKRIWRYCHCYCISTANGEQYRMTGEDRTPIWYVMDEVGSAVLHSDEPNFRLVPFLDCFTQTTYSLLFPIKDCEYGDQVQHDFLEYVAKEDRLLRSAYLLWWKAADFRGESVLQTEPEVEYFTNGHAVESYPEGDLLSHEPEIDRNKPLKVYAEYDVLREHLTASAFELVESAEEADILWLTTHYKNFLELARDTPNKFVNQFPFEYVLTIKDLLSTVCRRTAVEHHNGTTLETYPAWLPTTYNLKTELPQFVSYFQRRAAKGLDNHWIVKPWNLARGLDTYIANSLAQIVRLPMTGPKIAQKYIDRPVLFERSDLNAKVKFDIRYVFMVRSVQPLECFIHRKFFLRFCNKPFALNRLDDYEQHFTVMNYQENAILHHIKCDDFLIEWQQQYPEHPWDAIETDICQMLHQMLVGATKQKAPCGIAPCRQSRSMYAADIMLEWCGGGTDDQKPMKMQPKLLEVNFTPDCQRACDYYPEFFNDIFKLLFLKEDNEECFRQVGV